MSQSRWSVAVVVCVALVVALIVVRSCGDSPTATSGLETAAHGPPDGDPARTPETQPRPRRDRADAPVQPATSEPPQPAAQPVEEATGLSIEVVDESGVPAPGAAVRLWFADGDQYSHPGADAAAKLTVREYRPSAGKPVVLSPLPKETDGIRLRAFGSAEGSPPLAPVEFAIRAGRVEKVRLVAAKPQTADIVVVDATTDRPVTNASVVSATERDRRHAVDLGDPAPATTDAEGRCRLEGLGLGEHNIEADAKGYHQARTTWKQGELRVRMKPQGGACTVTVKVLGPDGVPVPNIRVSIVRTNRVVKTDAAGIAAFEDVAPGVVVVSLDMTDWSDASKAAGWTVEDYRRMTVIESAEPGEAYELVLGIAPPGLGSIEARLVGEDGLPVAQAKVEVFDVGNAEQSAVTDAGGNARFAPLPKGYYQATVSVGTRASWYFDGTELADGEHARVTWTLGSITIRGRVVAGADRHGVAGVSVWFRGAATGVATSAADGRFELPRARAGTFRLDAKSETAAAFARDVTVPTEGEVIVELIDFGRVAARFAAADREQLRAAEAWLFAVGPERDGSMLKPGAGENDLVAEKVLPGRYEVEVTLADRKRRFPVEVKSGETSVVEIRAP